MYKNLLFKIANFKIIYSKINFVLWLFLIFFLKILFFFDEVLQDSLIYEMNIFYHK